MVLAAFNSMNGVNGLRILTDEQIFVWVLSECGTPRLEVGWQQTNINKINFTLYRLYKIRFIFHGQYIF
jgi:hypothetical protein